MSQLNDYTKHKIIFLHEQNVGIREIGRRLNIARNTVRLWLRRYGAILAAQEGVTVINWPSKSPDLNPIENLWGQTVLNWDTTEVRNKHNLVEIVTSTWEHIGGKDLCWNMVRVMRSRLQQVIAGDGAPLRY